jgi:hypothetical protein
MISHLTPHLPKARSLVRSLACDYCLVLCNTILNITNNEGHYIDKIELIEKYGDQLGSNCLNGPLFECNQKVLEGFFEFKTSTCFIFI